MKKREIKEKVESYTNSWKKHGSGIQSLQWNSYLSAAKRYRNLVEDIDFSGKTVLDVGCGFGDIIPFIAAKTDSFTYTGIDLMPQFIEEAKNRYPDREFKFIVGDYFTQPLDEKFDIVLCSGALNGNMSDPITFRKDAITTMLTHSKETCAFNMAGGKNIKNDTDSNVYYADPEEILAFSKTLASKVILRDKYHPQDFTLVLFT